MTETKSQYGWLSYRQNLLVLFDDVADGGQSKAQKRIEQLFKDTDYQQDQPRPSFAQQWNLLNEIELRLFRLLDGPQLAEEIQSKFDESVLIPWLP